MKASTINKYKARSYKQLHGRAKFYFNKFIRLRDTDDNGYGKCIATGKRLKYGTEEAQAGHYYAGGLHKILEFNEDNVNLQSLQDNFFGHDFASYSCNLIDKIGMDRVRKLDTISKQGKRGIYKEDRYLMIEIIETYKAKVKVLAKTKMFKV